MLHLILASTAILACISTGGLLMVVVGIHRSEHGERLTSQPNGLSEALAHRLLAGSRGCHTRGDAEDPR
jgi:hypothetical protein